MNTIRFALSFFSRARSLQVWAPVTPHVLSSGSKIRTTSSFYMTACHLEQKNKHNGLLTTRAEGVDMFEQPPWHYQQIRTVKRGTEYQPKNIKRKRTHGWIKRLRTPGGIAVILRRMLKGRKSLSH